MEPDKATVKLGMLGFDDGRTMLIDPEDYRPQLVELHVRPSTSSPSRFKAVLTVPIGDDGQGAPLPFAQTGSGYTPEFRLEMN